MSGSRALGTGLLIAAGGITALMVLWLLVSGAQGGGIVLGLLLVFVLAGPLAGVGWFVLARQPTEEREAAAFASKRRVLEADRVFRQEVAQTLRTIGERGGAEQQRLLELAKELQSGAQVGSGWEDRVQLDDSDAALLSRYDDLVWERVRRLRDGPEPGETAALLVELRRALDQRQDLLLRGRRAPEIAASEVLAREAPATREFSAIGVGWAVSRDDTDYVVEGVASYFDEGQTWKLAHLVPTSPGARAQWLYVGPGGSDIALLDESESAVDVETMPLAASGTAVVDVVSGAGQAQGVLVAYRRYLAAERVALVERWPDGERAYSGSRVGSTDLELWPAAAERARN